MAQSIEDFIAATETAKRNLANYKGLVAEYFVVEYIYDYFK
jgi:hypothetical protein